MVTVVMVLFLMPTGPDSPEGYVSYGDLFIPYITGYLHNCVGVFSLPTRLHHIGVITYRISKADINYIAGTFSHPVLSDTEHVEGCKLVIDS